jgi:hypothetical protein
METKTMYSKLLEFQSTVETIKKDGKNTFFKKANGNASSYATLPNILAEVKPILNALKLVLTQPIVNGEVKTIITDSLTGEYVESGVVIPNGLNAQQVGSAITYFRRYTLSSLLALEIDEDDDGNKASQKTTEKKQPEMTLEFASNRLKDCLSIDELAKTYLSFTPDMQAKTIKVKDEMKTKLTGKQ